LNPELEKEWTVHLAARQPKRAFAVAGVCLFALFLSFAAFRSVSFTILMGAVLFSSLSDFFLPVHYRLTETGAEARHLWTFARIEWKQVKRRLMSNEGIKLSPLRRTSRLDAYRGVFLRFGDENPDTLLETIRRLQDSATARSERN
jgi:hypothetical protein